MSAQISTETSTQDSQKWQPVIAAFFCNWCTYTAADLAGVSRLKYAPNVRVIRLMCSGRLDPQFVLDAFAKGADGVLIGGCHPGDCHYAEGNYKALRRFEMLKRLAAQMGIQQGRLRLEWISASEGDKVRTVINDMVEQVRALGPLSSNRIEHSEPLAQPIDGNTHTVMSDQVLADEDFLEERSSPCCARASVRTPQISTQRSPNE